MGRIQSLQGILMFLVPISPNINRTVGAPPRLLCDLACKIAPASETTQGSGGWRFASQRAVR
jgi:hypothetical protein